MTSTTSYKNSLKQAWSIFKWTLKSSKAVWIIYLSLLAFSGICFIVLNIGVNSLIAVSGMAAKPSFISSLFGTNIFKIRLINSIGTAGIIIDDAHFEKNNVLLATGIAPNISVILLLWR